MDKKIEIIKSKIKGGGVYREKVYDDEPGCGHRRVEIKKIAKHFKELGYFAMVQKSTTKKGVKVYTLVIKLQKRGG